MSKKPDMAVYHVTERGEGENKKSFWTKIGAAWANADGKGFSLSIDYMPITAGRMVVRAPKADDTATDGGGE